MIVTTERRSRFQQADILATRHLENAEAHAARTARDLGRPLLLIYNTKPGEIEERLQEVFSKQRRECLDTLMNSYLIVPYKTVEHVNGAMLTITDTIVRNDIHEFGSAVLIKAYDSDGSLISA